MILYEQCLIQWSSVTTTTVLLLSPTFFLLRQSPGPYTSKLLRTFDRHIPLFGTVKCLVDDNVRLVGGISQSVIMVISQVTCSCTVIVAGR